MLPRAERLKKAGLFQRVYTARKSVSSQILSLFVLPKQGRSSGRLPLAGFVASKKIWAKASDRNRAKRRLREAYRIARQRQAPNEVESFRLDQWYAIVVVAQKDLLQARFDEIVERLLETLAKANQRFAGKKSSL